MRAARLGCRLMGTAQPRTSTDAGLTPESHRLVFQEFIQAEFTQLTSIAGLLITAKGSKHVELAAIDIDRCIEVPVCNYAEEAKVKRGEPACIVIACFKGMPTS